MQPENGEMETYAIQMEIEESYGKQTNKQAGETVLIIR